MKIGNCIEDQVGEIFLHCMKNDPEELNRLQDSAYSKATFGLQTPFCIEAESISSDDTENYYPTEYRGREASFRICNQWYLSNWKLFSEYMKEKQLGLFV